MLSDQAWIATVQPTNEDEQAEADTLLPGGLKLCLVALLCTSGLTEVPSSDVRKPGTVFDDALRDLVEALQMSILEYLKSTTKRPGEQTYFEPPSSIPLIIDADWFILQVPLCFAQYGCRRSSSTRQPVKGVWCRLSIFVALSSSCSILPIPLWRELKINENWLSNCITLRTLEFTS